MNFRFCVLTLLASFLAHPAAALDSWEDTVDRVSRGVVALRVSATRPFDTETSSVTVATGFVVDAERGLILTNRHVVNPGPVTADAVFLNHEKVSVLPVYRDPVHDFGFYRYDPKDLRFMQVEELQLAPERARVGADIRVIGNDAGEKLSILRGTLARLDREAPAYGVGRYNDFNTFYYQAASNSSGGSSGSPVVDQLGRVVALNAGGNQRSASSFFLPLDRVVRALERIRAGEAVTRGTLQTVFLRKPFDELERLGLRPEIEARVRGTSPDAVGLLVAEEVVPGGPGDGVIEPGDVLLSQDGRSVEGFAPLEAILDDKVGGTVSLRVERGGVPRDLEVPVGDLHAITPDSYVEFGGAILHPLSYQLARSHGVPAAGVCVASAGYVLARAGVPGGVVLTEVDDVSVATLADFERTVGILPDDAKFRVRYFHLGNPRNSRIAVARLDRRWWGMRRCDRDDALGIWPCVDAPAAPEAVPPGPTTTRLVADGSWAVRRLAHSLALVRFDVPLPVDGVQGRSFVGAAIVVDANAGLLLVDRDTVPVNLGDVTATFGGSVEVPARVVALHPEHNLALVQYDPALLGETPVRSASLSADPLKPGAAVQLVVVTPRHQILSRPTIVERVDTPSLPIPVVPRFRESNLDLITLTDTLPGVGGVLADRWGRVRAFWASFSTDKGGKASSFFAGIPAAAIEDWLAAGGTEWRTLGIETEPIPLSRARARGLPDEWAEKFGNGASDQHRVLAVRRITHGVPAADSLRAGDLLLAESGRPLSRVRDLERAAQRGRVSLTVARGGVVRDLELDSVILDASGAERVLIWAGAVLQEAPRELAQQRGLPRKGVYVGGRFFGTPAHAYRLAPTQRILAVDGVAVDDLQAFRNAVAGREHRESVRLTVADLEDRRRVLTVELDVQYWPTLELRRGPAGWVRVEEPSVSEASGAAS